LLKRDRLIEKVRDETGPYLSERWAALADHPLVGETRSRGLVGALELVSDKATRERFAPLGRVGTMCRDLCVENGLVMRAVGDTMIISPPLVIDKSQIDELVDLARRSLDLTAEHVL
jgi:putrescine aminotransferase